MSHQKNKEKENISNVLCVGCGIYFYKSPSRIVKYNFHSSTCFKEYQSKNDKFPWSDEVFLKNSGNNSHAWKDIMANESSLHHWVKYHKGRPELCIDCGVTNEVERYLDWSNQSGLYLRDLDDYVGRCRSCHKNYDTKLGFARKKSFDENGNRIGITLMIPEGY